MPAAALVAAPGTAWLPTAVGRGVAADDFSPAAAGAEVTEVVADLKPTSKGFPGDLGVLAEAPKLENAPDPRPNALDAGPPGLRMRLPPGVVAALNGLDFPCDELSPPNRLGRVVLRVEEGEAAGASPKLPREGLVLVDRESLLELDGRWVVSRAARFRRGDKEHQRKSTKGRSTGSQLTWYDGRRDYPWGLICRG